MIIRPAGATNVVGRATQTHAVLAVIPSANANGRCLQAPASRVILPLHVRSCAKSMPPRAAVCWGWNIVVHSGSQGSITGRSGGISSPSARPVALRFWPKSGEGTFEPRTWAMSSAIAGLPFLPISRMPSSTRSSSCPITCTASFSSGPNILALRLHCRVSGSYLSHTRNSYRPPEQSVRSSEGSRSASRNGHERTQRSKKCGNATTTNTSFATKESWNEFAATSGPIRRDGLNGMGVDDAG